MKFKSLLTAILFISSFYTAFAQAKLAVGTWRGVLKTASGVEIPFNFEVVTVAGKQHIAIINGAEHFKVDGISAKGDSVFIKMPLFDSEFRLKRDGKNLTGRWVRHLGDKDVNVNFTATSHSAWRFFKSTDKPISNITGHYAATFFGDADKKTMNVGEFVQKGDAVTGTFLSTTGDYRYLEGVVSGDHMYLSCFDGGHAYAFIAQIKGNNLVNGPDCQTS
jgi:hypothetical protein